MCEYCTPRLRADYTTSTVDGAAAFQRYQAMPSLADDDQQPTRADVAGDER